MTKNVGGATGVSPTPNQVDSWKTAIGELAVKTYLGTTRNHRARDDYYHDNNKQLHFCPHTAPVKLILPTLRLLCEKTRVLKWRFGSLVVWSRGGSEK